MTMNHTPGPWRVSAFEVQTGANARMVMAADDFLVAWVGERTGPENDANATLIAASPDLLDIVRRLVMTTEDIGVVIDDAQRIYAKATGSA